MKTKNFKVDEIALVLIVAILALAASIYERSNEAEAVDAEKITMLLMDDHEVSFVSKGVVDEAKLQEVNDMAYKELKSQLNAKGDFCIYLEDENGELLVAKGSSMLNDDGLECDDQ